MTNRPTIIVPELDHDARMLERYQHKVTPTGRIERRIVAALCAHMKERGWEPIELNDGDEITKVNDAKSAMELIFNLDSSYLTFSNGCTVHSVFLVNGNGVDMVSDWHYRLGDPDGFNAAMKAFDAEDCA